MYYFCNKCVIAAFRSWEIANTPLAHQSRYKSFVQIIIINLLVEYYYQRSDSCVIVFQNQRFCYAKIRRDTFIEVFTHLEKFYADCNKFISRINNSNVAMRISKPKHCCTKILSRYIYSKSWKLLCGYVY